MSDNPCRGYNADNEPSQSYPGKSQPMRWVFESLKPENELDSGNQEVVVTCLDKLKSDLIAKFDAKMKIYADVISRNTRTLRSQSTTSLNKNIEQIETLIDRVDKLQEKFECIDSLEAKLKEMHRLVIAMEVTFDCRLKEQLMQWIWKGCPDIPCTPTETVIPEPYVDSEPCESPPFHLKDPFKPSSCPTSCLPKPPCLRNLYRQPSCQTDPCETPPGAPDPCRAPSCASDSCKTSPCAPDPCRISPCLTDLHRLREVPIKNTTADRMSCPPPECCKLIRPDSQRSKLPSSPPKKCPRGTCNNFP